MTVFIRSRMNIDLVHATYYMGAMFYTLIRFICLGLPELSLTASRLAVFYKQRDFYFYPAWTYFIPAAILKIPFSLLDAFLWTSLTYYVIGYSPELERCVFQGGKNLNTWLVDNFSSFLRTKNDPFKLHELKFWNQPCILDSIKCHSIM